MEVERTPTGLRVSLPSGPLRGLDLQLPQGWERVTPEDPDEFTWALGAATMRVRLREAPRFGLDVEVHNGDPDETFIGATPVLVLRSPGPRLPWLAGATGQVLLPEVDGGAVFRQWRGHCGAPPGGGAGDIALFGDAVWVRPGQSIGSGWRLEPAAGSLPEDPSPLPERRFVTEGDGIELFAPDAALSAPGLTEATEGETTLLTGPIGVHEVRLSDARGTTVFEVGWHLAPDEIADEARTRATSPDITAWLTVAANQRQHLDDPATLDELDMMLATALEAPTPWAVLAALRAAAVTELPVGAEAMAAAADLLDADPDSELAPLLWAQGMAHAAVPGATQGTPAADWWDVLTRDDEELRHRVLDWVDHGRVTSVPPAHGARGIALACLWLATREVPVGQHEVVRAATRTFARLLAIHSVDPDPVEVAWLLLADSWLFEA